MKKGVKWGIAVAVVGVALFAAVTAAKSGKKGVEVRAEEVQRRDLVASVTASGKVQPRTKVDVASDVSGRIVTLAVKEGQLVSKGQFLLQIDPENAQASLQRAEASLAAARAQSAQAKANLLQSTKNYERTAAIRKTNAQLVSDEQMEQLRTSMEVNQALAESAEHNVEQTVAAVRDARNSLTKTRIVAPMSGRITRLIVEQGETAVPGTFNKDAATLLTISDMGVLETKVKVDETDVARIHLGDSAAVDIDAFPDTTFYGRVVEISNSSVRVGMAAPNADQAVDYEVTIQLLNPPPDTRPDFSTTAKIITDTRKAVIAIPIIALTVREHENVKQGDQPVGLAKAPPAKEVGKKDVEGVFVIGKDNKVSFRPVKTGIAGEKYFEVVSGLKEKEKIVGGTYQAIRELKDGSLIREAKTPKPGDTKKAAETKTT
jgi:HlyD family secretion protein